MLTNPYSSILFDSLWSAWSTHCKMTKKKFVSALRRMNRCVFEQIG